VDLTFNLITIDGDYGKSFKIALPVDNQRNYCGKRIEMLPVDEYCPISKEEIERIINRLIEIPN
jgi:hypothetical protein